MARHEITPAYGAIDTVRELFREYIHEEYEIKRKVSLAFQNVDVELKTLPGEYGEAAGGLFLAYSDGNAAGCGAFRKIDETRCELKRLYVRSQYRGQGLGKKILSRLLHEAKNKGYSCAYFDTLRSLQEAMRLYTAMGFTETEPYNDNPLPDVLFFKKDL